MGVEVKGAGDGVVIADRGCNDGCGYIEINQVVAALKGTTTPAQ